MKRDVYVPGSVARTETPPSGNCASTRSASATKKPSLRRVPVARRVLGEGRSRHAQDEMDLPLARPADGATLDDVHEVERCDGSGARIDLDAHAHAQY